MPMGGFAMASPAAQDEEEAAPKAVKTSFTVSIYYLTREVLDFTSLE